MKNLSVFRRVLAAGLMLVLLAAAVPAAFAAGDRLTLTADKTEAVPGDVITLNVATEATGSKVGGIQFIVKFDANRFELVKGSSSFVEPYTGRNITIKVVNTENVGQVNYVAVFSKGMDTGNTMATLQLKVKEGANGVGDLQLAEVVAADDTTQVNAIEMAVSGTSVKLPDPPAGATPAPEATPTVTPNVNAADKPVEGDTDEVPDLPGKQPNPADSQPQTTAQPVTGEQSNAAGGAAQEGADSQPQADDTQTDGAQPKSKAPLLTFVGVLAAQLLLAGFILMKKMNEEKGKH